MTNKHAEEPVTSPWMARQTAFSTRMPPKDLAMFMRICPERHYAKGDTIFLAGDPAADLHVIAAGRVKLVTSTASGNERILAVCGVDDFIGEGFLQETQYYQTDAKALTDVITCPMNRQQFLQLALKAPNVVLTFAHILASSLFYCREQLASSYDPVKVRVIKTLLAQAYRFGQAPEEGGWVTLHAELKHDEIAALITSTRVAVTTALSELRQAGLVEGSRGKYRLYLPGLEAFLEP